MRILCYMQPQRGGGVARHAAEIINGLAGLQEFQCTLLASGPDLRRHVSFTKHYPGIPLLQHPLPGVWIERIWKAAGWPPLERRCRGFDVIYSPAEARLPRCGIPSIITLHDVQALETDLPWSRTPIHQAFRRKWLRWLPNMLAEATRIATVSEFSRQRIVELLRVDPGRVVVVGNGVSPAFFRAPFLADRPPNPSIIVIGGLRLKKGAEETLRVAGELHRRRSDLVVEIFGQHDSEWIPHAAEHRNVRLHGYIDDDSLAQKLSESTALLFLSPYEGFGIPAIEAMAAGTPAVVAKAASLPEVVGEAGIVVDPTNYVAIADALEKLRHDVVLRNRQVELGRLRAGLFTWSACVDRLAATCREVAA